MEEALDLSFDRLLMMMMMMMYKPIHFVCDMFWPTLVIIREFVQLKREITKLADRL